MLGGPEPEAELQASWNDKSRTPCEQEVRLYGAVLAEPEPGLARD